MLDDHLVDAQETLRRIEKELAGLKTSQLEEKSAQMYGLPWDETDSENFTTDTEETFDSDSFSIYTPCPTKYELRDNTKQIDQVCDLSPEFNTVPDAVYEDRTISPCICTSLYTAKYNPSWKLGGQTKSLVKGELVQLLQREKSEYSPSDWPPSMIFDSKSFWN